MQPTIPPWAWVSSWERRARSRAGVAPRARDSKYAFYGLRKDSRHFIRLDPLAKGLLLPRQWGTSAPVTWRVERFHHTEPWPVPDIKSIQSYRPYEPVPIMLAGEMAGPPGPLPAGPPRTVGPPQHSWSYGARGWAAGAVILALLVLLVRAAENCLHKKLFKAIYAHTNAGAVDLHQNEMRSGHYRLQGVRRQESDEWSTPSVMATSMQVEHRDFDTGSIDNLDDMENLPQLTHHSDMPPPYSECARPILTNSHKLTSEEPPPPYSACYVAYTNPKNAEPQVHIRRQSVLDDRPHASTDLDNAHNNLIENGIGSDAVTIATGSNDVDNALGMRTELVFDNGRIVERLSSDLNYEIEVASNEDMEVHSTRHEVIKDRVVYIDETAGETSSPGGALLV